MSIKDSSDLNPDFSDLWRETRDHFTTPNIYRCLAPNQVEMISENFRQSKMHVEHILFFSFENKLYFPIWFEFRSINNHLLFLFKELQINSFEQLRKILVSSLKKEEGIEANVIPLVFHTQKMPTFCVELADFKVDVNDAIIASET